MILSVNNGSFSYKKGKNILNDISFCVNSGETLAILGPNGVGKTTLLKCIMGFLPWNSGDTTIDDISIKQIPQRELWRKIAYVPQAKSAAISYTAEEMIMLGRSSHIGLFNQPANDDFMIVDHAMEMLGITSLKGKKCNEISGGELQMILIARALVSRPEVLILDEPESNLDFKNQLLVLDTISSLASDGIACIFNTHYPAHALQRATKSLLLGRDGSIIFGDTHTVVTEDNIEKAFGVKAVIGEVETEQNIMRDIIPISVSTENYGKFSVSTDTSEKLAVISVITDRDSADLVNKILHQYHSYIVGRMGMPYKKYGANIINLTLDAPADVLNTISSRLSTIPKTSVKTVFR